MWDESVGFFMSMGFLEIVTLNYVVVSDNQLYVLPVNRKNVLVNLQQTYMSDGAWLLMKREVLLLTY